MKWIAFSNNKFKVLSLAVITSLAVAATPAAFAKHCKHHCKKPCVAKTEYKDVAPMPVVPVFTPSWYVGGHVGESRTHDQPAPGSGDSVTQIGPGWTADLGYQLFQWHRAIFGGELGYTQYHDSKETTVGTVVASTEHFATYLAAVGQYPVVHNFNVLGKLGLAYSYARKVFTASGASASANAYSLYWGLGVSYDVTQQAALVLQWDRARGNSKTGSTDLASLGVSYRFL